MPLLFLISIFDLLQSANDLFVEQMTLKNNNVNTKKFLSIIEGPNYKSFIFLKMNIAIRIAIGWMDAVMNGLKRPFSAHISKNGSVM